MDNIRDADSKLAELGPKRSREKSGPMICAAKRESFEVCMHSPLKYEEIRIGTLVTSANYRKKRPLGLRVNGTLTHRGG